MSLLKELKDAETLNDLARLLGFSAKTLAFVLYKIPDEKKYHTFEVPKKDGGVRVISAPDNRLKNLQRRLANILNSCVLEIDQDNELKILAHGFKVGLSIHTNANSHKNRRYVLNFDIKVFLVS